MHGRNEILLLSKAIYSYAMEKDVQDCMATLLEFYGGSIVNSLAEKHVGKVFVEGMKKKNKFVLGIWS